MPHIADLAPFLPMECSFELECKRKLIMTRGMVLSRLPDTTVPSLRERISHVPPAILSQESHFRGDTVDPSKWYCDRCALLALQPPSSVLPDLVSSPPSPMVIDTFES